MKRAIIILTTLLAWVSTLSAGNNSGFMQLGIKGGITSDKQDVKINNEGLNDLFSDASTGYMAGLMLRFSMPFVPVYLQPEFNYSWNKYSNDIATVKAHSFDIPVLVGLGIGGNFKLRANLGPVFNVSSGAKVSGEYDVSPLFERPKVSWTAGLGIDLSSLMLDFRYNGQFKDSEKSILNFNNVDTSHKSWMVTLGFKF